MLHQKVFVRSSRGRATKVLSSSTRKSLTIGCKRTLSTDRHSLWLRTLLRVQCNPLINITSRYFILTLSPLTIEFPVLPSKAPSHPLFAEGHYIIPDTNILLHCVCLCLENDFDGRWISLRHLHLRGLFSFRRCWMNFVIGLCLCIIVSGP